MDPLPVSVCEIVCTRRGFCTEMPVLLTLLLTYAVAAAALMARHPSPARAAVAAQVAARASAANKPSTGSFAFWEETQSSSAPPEPPSSTDAPSDLDAWLRAGGALVLMFYDRINKILPHLMYHCPPGPPVVQHRLLINAQKGGSLPFCLLLMWWRKNWSSTAVVYTGLHGSYGLIWLLKDHVFRDKSWDQRITAVSATFTIIVLGLYWLAPALVILNNLHVSPARQLLCIVVNILGQVLMMVSDCHKHFALEYHRDLAREKKYLLQEGLFATNRNPNYLGEMMVYGAFAGMCPRHEPWCVMLFLWIVVFGNNMAAKDKSLQKKPGWKEYSKRSWLFLPKPNLSCLCRHPQSAKKD